MVIDVSAFAQRQKGILQEYVPVSKNGDFVVISLQILGSINLLAWHE